MARSTLRTLRTLRILLATLTLVALAAAASATTREIKASELVGEAGSSLTLSFEADANYRVADVHIDGQSVGAVERYDLAGEGSDVEVEVRFASLLDEVVPAAASPVSGATATSLNPALSVYNPLVAQALGYEFEVALDPEFTKPVASHATLTSLTATQTAALVRYLAMN